MNNLTDYELNTLTNIGKNVKYVRKNILGMYVVELCELTGISRDVICRLESLSKGDGSMGKGRVYPSISTLLKFCESTGIKMGDLIDKDISMDRDIQDKIISKCKEESEIKISKI